MPVNTKHAEYSKNLYRWKLVRDCSAGSDVVKAAGAEYLPVPNAKDKSAENKVRYEAYKKRAQFVNFVSRTKNGLSGAVFRKAPELSLPEAIAYIEQNANGAGLSLEQLTKDVINDILETGNYGLLIDVPQNSEDSLTKEQMRQLGFGASIKLYPPESIINWKTDGIKTTLVVLRETVEHTVDGFDCVPIEQYRELRLEDGRYVQRVWVDNVVIDEFEPRKSDGSLFDEIPFVKIGSINNDMTVDPAPLYDIAEINIGHYINSADYEESCFLVGQPTPWISGLDQNWVDTVLKSGVALGARSPVLLPETGQMGLVQAAPNSQPHEAMKLKEDQLVKVGARIISDGRGVETAEAVRIRFSSENSVLANIVNNVTDGIFKALVFVGEFMGIDVTYDNTVFSLNTEFFDQSLDPQAIMASIALLDRGVIAKQDLRSRLRKSNMIDADRTDDDIETDVEVVNPVA